MIQPKPKNWYYKLLRIAQKDLGIAEEQYRDMLMHFGATEKNGKISATTMTVPMLEKTFSHMKSLGFRVLSKRGKDIQIAKCKRLWDALHKADVMRQPYSETVLTKYAFRVTKVNNIRWASPTGLAKTIEALKGMAKREGVNLENH